MKPCLQLHRRDAKGVVQLAAVRRQILGTGVVIAVWTPRGTHGFHIPATMEPERQADGSWTVTRKGQTMRMPEGGFFFDGGWPSFEDRPWPEFAAALRSKSDRLVFWGGGCNTQQVLGTGTVDEVRANVRHLVSTLGADGDMVFTAVHNIMGDVPPQNIVAMYDAALACGSPGRLPERSRMAVT